jgi:hypothetical protein
MITTELLHLPASGQPHELSRDRPRLLPLTSELLN